MTIDIDALRALDTARQPAPAPGHFRFPPTDADSAWLTAICDAGPALIDEVERLRSALAVAEQALADALEQGARLGAAAADAAWSLTP